jgi:thioredoxin 2
VGLATDDRGILMPCPACGTRNRVPYGADANCGQCQTRLPAPAEPIEASSATAFDALVGRSRIPIVVDFWAPWCGPCRTVAPEIARVAAAHRGEWLVVKVNTEALPELAGRFSIQSIPTMAVFEGGRERTRTMGARPASDIETFVHQALGTRPGR